MSNISRGLGSLLALGSTNIGSITKVSSPQMKRDTIDVTTLSSANGFKQFIAGLVDGGTLAVEGLFDTADAGQMLLYNKFIGSSLDVYTVTFPTIVGASWTATCLITDLDLGGDADISKALTFKATLKISGQPIIGLTANPGLIGLSMTGTSGVIAPAFGSGVYSYAWEFVTSQSVTVLPTSSIPQQYTIYVDGVNQGVFNTGSISPYVAFATVGAHKIDIVVSSAGYSPITYTIIAVRTS